MTTNEHWVGTEQVWGDAAYQEIKRAFPGKLKSRSVALCVWCYAHNPNVTEAEIEALARTDAEIVAQRQRKKISAHGPKRAKALLGLNTAAAEVTDPNLSGVEQALLTNFRKSSALVEGFRKCERRLQRAARALDQARAALRDITPQNAHNLAEADASARAVLAAEGLLEPTPAGGDRAVAAKPVAAKPVAAKPVAAKPVAAKPVAAKPVAVRPVAAQPVAADIALDILRKKVTTTRKPSLGSVDDVPSPFPTPDHPVIIEEDFYAMKAEEHAEEFFVVWPEDAEDVDA